MPLKTQQVTTGIAGLDAILFGGLSPEEMYLVQGGPGTGKTTVGLQFLLDGAARGESVLFITLAQSQRTLEKIAVSHGWNLEKVHIRCLPLVPSRAAGTHREQSVFHTGHVELAESMDAIMATIDAIKPDRVVIDSIDQLRLLADGRLQHQRKLLVLREFLAARGCTALVLDSGAEDSDPSLAELTHGILRLERLAPIYGDARRRLCCLKMRGANFHGGYHDFALRRGGLVVFPRLQINVPQPQPSWRRVGSGVPELDALLGGGLEEGTACLVAGSPGTGKTFVSTLYVHAAAQRGEHGAIFLFDERLETFFERSRHLGMDIRPMVDDGIVQVHQINAAEISPGEFSQMARNAVERDHAKVVMIDSLTGYFHAMPNEQMLLLQMHELLSYLGHQEVLSLLVVAQHGLVSHDRGMSGPLDISYMSDAVLLLRHFEAVGEVRQAISVIKKRHGAHERSIRELQLTPEGVKLGKALVDFEGVLTFSPVYTGLRAELLSTDNLA